MKYDIPDNLLNNLSKFILKNTGLFFPEKKWKALNKGVITAAQELKFDTIALIDHLLSRSPKKDIINTLVGYLTIGETYFLRDKNFFQILGDEIIRGRIKKPTDRGKKITFWSAGCASGEEPYSIAILIDHMFPALNSWDVKILGTDINKGSLEKAKNGIYSKWSLRETPENIMKKYFQDRGNNQYKIIQKIKERVNFSHLNLNEKSYSVLNPISEKVDVILCRNVLMYFNDEKRNDVIHKLTKYLVNGGWFVTGPAESGFVQSKELSPVKFTNVIFFQKGPVSPKRTQPFSPVNNKNRQEIKPLKNKATPEPSKPNPDQPAQSDTNNALKQNYDIYLAALKEYEKGNYSQSAEKLSNILIQGNSDNNSFLLGADSMILLAKSYANMGDIANALKWCEKAIAAEKLNPEIYYFRSTIYQSMGDNKASIRALKQALYLDPEFVMAYFSLGLILQTENRSPESKKNMENALSLLKSKEPDEILPYSEGMTAGRLMDTIQGMVNKN